MKILITLLFALVIFSGFATVNPSSSLATSGNNNHSNEQDNDKKDKEDKKDKKDKKDKEDKDDKDCRKHPERSECHAEVPEFGIIPGALAALSSGGAFLYLRKKIIK